MVSGRDSILLCVSVWQKAKNSSLKNFYVVKRDFAEVQINFFLRFVVTAIDYVEAFTAYTNDVVVPW